VAWAKAFSETKRFMPSANPPPAMAEVPSMKLRRERLDVFEVNVFMLFTLDFDLLDQG
jgi:hypothetical protein